MDYDVRQGKYLFKRVSDTFMEPDKDAFPDHYHTEYELLCLISGDADFFLKGLQYHMTPMCLQVVRPGEYHHIEVMPNTKYDRIVIRFSEADIPFELRKQLKHLMPMYTFVNPYIKRALYEFESIIKAMDENTLFCSLTNMLNVLLGYLISCDAKPIKPVYSDEKFKNILSYIDKNITLLDSVNTVCRGLYISKTSLNRMFAINLNISPMEYIRTQKCMLAQSLLSNGEKAAEVYISCGFNDYSSFYRNYMRVFGEAPTQHTKR